MSTAAARRSRAAPLVLLALAGCPTDQIVIEGEFGRPIDLASGDGSPLPRLVFTPDVCRGDAGGCASICTAPPDRCPADACLPILIDSGSPVTLLPGDALAAARTCFEVRSARGALADAPADVDLLNAITRVRFDSVPLVRIPRDPAEIPWAWQVGDQGAAPGVGGVLGGNVLRELAVRFTAGDPMQVTLYREFPGTEDVLADQGSAALPLQFPGLLLGKLIDDVCQLDGDGDCDFVSFGVFDRNHPESALQATRMVLDACLGAPPSAVVRDPTSGRCALAAGPGRDPRAYRAPTGASGALSTGCRAAIPSTGGGIDRGHDASFVVATGVPGLVLFEDSALRMFGTLELPACDGDVGGAPACLAGQAGVLRAAGWPPAGTAEAPLVQLRVRSLALLPGLAESVGTPPCQRLEVRLRALRAQCESARKTLVPRDADPASCRGAAATSAAVLGQAFLREGEALTADPWIPTLVVPADHPLVTSLRRDVSPEALQPDGLLGTALLQGTDVVLDYTDPTPSVRVACLDADGGACLAMPACAADSDPASVVPACCFGLPEDLLVALIRDEGAYGCCAALSPATVEELNASAATEGRELPCPART